MAEKYEFDFQKFNVDTLYGKYDTTQLAAFGDLWLKKYEETANGYNVVKDLTYSAKVYSGFSDNQKNYLTRLVREFTTEGIQYEKDFLLWYNSRPDIQEIYTWAFNDNGNSFMYVQHPTKSTWSYKGDSDWDSSWEQTPANSNMFWRVCGDWNVRKFVAVNRETTYSEGDLVVLRTPFIGNWDYDPLWDRQNMPDKTVLRIGTILEMTSSIHRNSRAGKGSRAVQVLWNGTTETKQVPERVLKHLERKRRTKK